MRYYWIYDNIHHEEAMRSHQMRNVHLPFLFTGLIAMIVLAACQSAAPAPPEERGEAQAPPSSGGGAVAPTPATVAETPDWLDIELRDVNSGEMFKLSDFEGQIVFVEQMAVWCTNCRRQQHELVKLHEQIGDAAISIAIDVDLNENEELLKRHAETYGFDWRYAVATPELVEAFVARFGNQIINPSSVPMLLIDKQGDVHLLEFGHKTVEYLIGVIDSFQ